MGLKLADLTMIEASLAAIRTFLTKREAKGAQIEINRNLGTEKDQDSPGKVFDRGESSRCRFRFPEQSSDEGAYSC